MLSEIYIFSQRAEVLVNKNYRFDITTSTKDVFTRKLRELKNGHVPPHFVESDVTYYYIKRNGLYFVATSRRDVSPVLVTELLTRVYHMCKDFCGMVTEDSLKANIVMIQELLDEILDMGYAQLTSTDKLKPYIQSDPVMVRPTRSPSEEIAARMFGIENRVAPCDAANRPVVMRKHTEQDTARNEIFLDIIERMTAVVGSNGSIVRMEVNGTVNMRSFLSGSPVIKVALNEDLTISQPGSMKGYGNQVHFDQCRFHPSVNLDGFEESRVVSVQPPSGEFAVLTYTINGDLPLGLPFQVRVFVTDAEQSRDVELVVRVQGVFPGNIHAVNVLLKIPVSKHVTSITQQLSGTDQAAELMTSSGQVVWRIKKFTGGIEHIARFRLITQDHRLKKKDIGPVAMEFEISGLTSSGLHIRFLRVFDRERSYVPFRWVRYITVSDSYLVRLSPT